MGFVHTSVPLKLIQYLCLSAKLGHLVLWDHISDRDVSVMQRRPSMQGSYLTM